ncbi:putative Cytochrome P450 [Melia azedarach]|uniref:Cytochrome P450 n=1 Tax=Melia azedarach TaxID=155640 RepID=A0ACC1YFC5_MELAZ|nr:putative Cytochrome P450 [Melia azedarach]
MNFLTVFLFISLPIILLFLLNKHRTRQSVCWPPGPTGLPLIGNLHQFYNPNPPSYLWNLSKQYGALMSLRLGFVPTLVVSSARMAKEIMKTHDLRFCSRPVFTSQKKLTYNCLDLAFAPYNDYWREMRKICTIHLFSSVKVQHFRPIREDEVFGMIDKISKLAVASKPVNLSDILISVANNITCRVAFGKRYEDEATERSRFHGLLNETQAMLGCFFFSDYFPFMSWVDKLTGMTSRLERNFQEFDAFLQELIEERLDPKNSKTEEDIMDVLLQLQKQREFKIELALDHVKGVLMDVVIGGTDTGAATVIWAMTYLMKNPRVMKRAQEEVRQVVKNKDSILHENDVQRLQYLKAVVKESMRLQPTAPLLVPRETIEKCTVAGYEIPFKTVVYVNAWAIGRDPEAWDNAEEFDPDRFMGSSIDLKGQNYELIPFGAGRRMCPGMFMGLAIVELTLANLLWKFDWEMPAGMEKEDLDFDVLPGVTMHKKNVLWLMASNVQ